MSHQGSRSARARSLTLAAALFAALGVFTLFVARADAVVLTGSPSPLPGSKFEGGDANQEATLGNLDWANAPFIDHAPDPNTDDNIFAGGSEGKENNPGNWNFGTKDGGSTPPKNNILDAYSELEPNTNDVFLHLAFTRGNDTGTTYMAFELNQRTNLWNNGKANIPCRTTGDIIVSYQVSGNTPDVILQKWTSTSSDGATGCAKTGSLTDYTAVVDNVNAQGGVNAAPIDNVLSSSYPWGTQIPAKLFGEGSLNLTSLLSGALGTPCFSFGSIWMHTRASTSDSSNLDDYIAPRPLLIRNCSASGTKFHDLNGNGAKDAGEPGLAGFRMWADYDNDGVRDEGEPYADTDASGNYTITKIQDPSGTYSIREQLTAGGGTGGWTCSYPATTGSGGDFPCAYTGIDGATTPNVSGKDFGNYKQAVVKVAKQTVPDGAPESFAFASTIPGKASFNLSDDGVETTTVTPGTYIATEAAHPDYDLTGIACTGDGDSSGAGQTATFNAQSGETITCTFTNTRKTGRLTVRKVLDPSTDPGTFDLKIGNDVVVDDGGHLAQGSRTLPTGTGYTVTELGGTGTSLVKYDSAIECKDGDTVVTSGTGTSLSGVPVIAGHDVVCTFTNTRRPGTIKVVKDLVPNDDQGTFDLKVGDDVVKAAAGDGDQGSMPVAPGTYEVSEAGDGGTSLADYDSRIACLKNDEAYKSGTGTSIGGLDVDSDDAIVCTITNTRLGSVTVTKTEGGQEPSGTWAFRLTGGPDEVDITKNTTADGNPLSFGHLKPGDYTLCEIGLPAGWHSSLGPVVDGKVCIELKIEAGEAEALPVDNTRPETIVIKEGNKQVHHGDTITYTFDVSNAGNTPLKDVSVEDERCDNDPVRDAAHDQNDDGDTLLETGEVWRFTCAMVVPEEHDAEEENPIHNVATAHAFDQAGNEVTDTDSHDTTIIHPAIAVQKSGAEFAYAGDTVTYTFAATNNGDTPLHGVTVSDDRCAPVTGPIEKQGGNADELLDPGETWMFTCAKQIPADHKIGDENPIRNVATATGKDPLDKTVTSTDDHQVRVLHPAVDIEKTGPATAAVGTPLGYTLTVTNPGDVPFAAQEVGVTDPRCEAPPAGPNTGGDATPGQLDPGDTWIYTCTAQTTGQPAGTFVNTATVTAKDFNGHPVSDTDAFPTTLAEQQQVLPEEIVSGTARLGGPSGCVKTAFNATVRGRKIAKVTFYVDGAKLKRIVAKSSQRVFRVKVRPGRALGVHRVTARVVFKASSRTKARTLRLSFRRCARQVVTPQFTG